MKTLTLSLGTLVMASVMMTDLFAQDGGGLGSVSTCPSAPIIAAAASSYALSEEGGLTAAQASKVIQNIVQQSSASAPYAAPQIAAQVMAGISQAAKDAASQGLSIPSSVTPAQLASLPASLAVTTTAYYQSTVSAVAAGAIQGLGPAAAKYPDLLAQVVSAITTSIVREAAVQAAATAISKQNGTSDASKTLPMGSVENAEAVAKAVVSSVLETCAAVGVSPISIKQAINGAKKDCVAEAQNVATLLVGDPTIQAASQTPAPQDATAAAGQVAGQVAGEVAGQVAQQVAQQVALAVAQQVAQQAASQTTGTQPAANQTSTTPSQSATLQNSVVPNNSVFVNPPPIPPTPTPTPATPPPTPVPTPKPSSGQG